MLPHDWQQCLLTSNTISTKRLLDIKHTKRSNTRSNLSTNAASPGKHHFTGGNHIAVAINAVPVESESTKASIIEDKLTQQCPQLVIEEEHPVLHSPHEPIQKKVTRAQLIPPMPDMWTQRPQTHQ